MKCVVCDKPGEFFSDIRSGASYCHEHHQVIKEAEREHKKHLDRIDLQKNR